ncbi:MAG: hypothetical protein LBM98_13670 [Oscillospiraceae bacterium]|nr:hypothetical protein [Oscillospiraceae bacterium]
MLRTRLSVICTAANTLPSERSRSSSELAITQGSGGARVSQKSNTTLGFIVGRVGVE